MAHQHGAARICAALTAAPASAVLVSLALPAVLPVAGDVRLLLALLIVLPAVATGVCLALLSRSGARAWGGCALVCALSSLVLVLT
ncbi:hypothetical protein LXT21_21210 [Myxococcus sp. K38C18041901]|uniref:hypothetical protein n=1 Tax=Myxococcus guangdongensis TaxID=2906760 RepID=UPI0020A6E8A8|nr:hypothetical protein [Myxococcus guangdongensis]MCP3061303.1 hypothetical protein [Myxococcus guangdongensis]